MGTLDSYWQAHMELLGREPPMDLYDPDWPIRTHGEALPPARLSDDSGCRGMVANSMLAAGSVVGCATVTHSVLSTNVRVGDGSMLEESVVLPNARIGANCRLRRVIVDSGVAVPDGTIIGWSSADPVERTSGAAQITLVTRDLQGAGAATNTDFRSVA